MCRRGPCIMTRAHITLRGWVSGWCYTGKWQKPERCRSFMTCTVTRGTNHVSMFDKNLFDVITIPLWRHGSVTMHSDGVYAVCDVTFLWRHSSSSSMTKAIHCRRYFAATAAVTSQTSRHGLFYIKIMTSPLWRHGVTWRHQEHDQPIARGHFPIGYALEPSPIWLRFPHT